jgi:hypothetical protein
MIPVTMTLNNSLHCMIARSMPLRIVLCHSSLQPVAIVRLLTRDPMIVAMLAVDVGDLSEATLRVRGWELQSFSALVRQKRSDFLRNSIESQRRNPRHMWQSIDMLMGRGHSMTTSDLTADDLHHFLVHKVDRVRDGAPDPVYRQAPQALPAISEQLNVMTSSNT